jgi:hypothetical protein
MRALFARVLYISAPHGPVRPRLGPIYDPVLGSSVPGLLASTRFLPPGTNRAGARGSVAPWLLPPSGSLLGFSGNLVVAFWNQGQKSLKTAPGREILYLA